MKPTTVTLITILSLCFFATEIQATSNNREKQRIVTQIPNAAKVNDITLIQKFIDRILKGDEPGARYLATDGGDEETSAHIHYSGEKIAHLNIFNNPKAKIDAIYYYQDTITEAKHLRYYFVIYENGQHRYPEVMKIEMINYDDLFYLNRFWAPR